MHDSFFSPKSSCLFFFFLFFFSTLEICAHREWKRALVFFSFNRFAISCYLMCHIVHKNFLFVCFFGLCNLFFPYYLFFHLVLQQIFLCFIFWILCLLFHLETDVCNVGQWAHKNVMTIFCYPKAEMKWEMNEWRVVKWNWTIKTTERKSNIFYLDDRNLTKC